MISFARTECFVVSLNASLMIHKSKPGLLQRIVRRHRELSSTTNRVIKLIDKNVRHRISSIRDTGDHN